MMMTKIMYDDLYIKLRNRYRFIQIINLVKINLGF